MRWFRVGIVGLTAASFFGAILYLGLIPFGIYEDGFFVAFVNAFWPLITGLLFLAMTISLYQRKKNALPVYCLLMILLIIQNAFDGPLTPPTSLGDFLWILFDAAVLVFLYAAIKAGELT